MPAQRLTADALQQSATALQQQYHFRYPLPALTGKRVAAPDSEGGELLTDDFAPADLYRVTPVKLPKRQ